MLDRDAFFVKQLCNIPVSKLYRKPECIGVKTFMFRTSTIFLLLHGVQLARPPAANFRAVLPGEPSISFFPLISAPSSSFLATSPSLPQLEAMQRTSCRSLEGSVFGFAIQNHTKSLQPLFRAQKLLPSVLLLICPTHAQVLA